jgi:alkylated DNA repair dioxygenase AlkB
MAQRRVRSRGDPAGSARLDGEVVNCVINEYFPGQGSAGHRDHSADLQPRSLWVLAGEARSHWHHGIAARRSDQVAD